jgi:hypothetical protein
MAAEIPIDVLESRYRDDDSEEESNLTLEAHSGHKTVATGLQGGLQHADQVHAVESNGQDDGEEYEVQDYDEDDYDEEDSDEDVMAALEWADMRDGEIWGMDLLSLPSCLIPL